MSQRGYRNRFRLCVLPGYNWCGPGCSGPGPPVNEVDAACKAHDECYRNSRNYCECDYAFLRRLQPITNENTLTGRHARLLYHYMKFQILFNCGF